MATNEIDPEVCEVIKCCVETSGWHLSHVDTEFVEEDSRARELLADIALGLSISSAVPEISTVTASDNSNYLADSNKSMSLHTDNVYLKNPCKRVVLFCLEPASKGGDSLILDTNSIEDTISSSVREELEKHQWSWAKPPRMGGGYSEPAAVLNESGEVRWWRRGLRLATEETVEVANHFEAVINQTPALARLGLSRGDLLVLDNSRVLHGRAAFFGSKRKLLRARIW